MPGTLTRWREWPLAAFVGVALVLLGAGAVVISTAFADDPTPRVRGGDRPVNAGAGNLADISAHNSPTVARSPVRPTSLAVANRIDTPRFSCALHVSSDGGDRWLQIPIPRPRGEEPKCYAPDVAFGADGTFSMSFVTLRGRGNVPHAVWLVTSKDGGRTLSKPQRLLGQLAFQVRLVADPQRPGRLYLTWLQAADVAPYKFTGPGNPIRFIRSDDGGRTWTPPARVSSAARGRVVAPSLAVGPRGELNVIHLDLGNDRLDYEGGHGGIGGPPYPGRFQLVLSRSQDGGATWRESVVDRGIVPIERFLAFLPAFPSVAVDRRSGRVYAGHHDGRLGKADVWVWSLGRGDSEWEGPTRVNDTAERDGTSQYLPRLAVAPNGRLDVVYFDRRADPRDVKNEVSLQSSFDAGESFTPRARLSSRAFSSRIGFGSERRMPDLGSRLGLVSDEAHAFAVWTDTRAGTEASNKQDISQALVAVPEPAGLSDPVEYGLRYGGLLLALLGLGLAVAAVRRSGRARAAP